MDVQRSRHSRAEGACSPLAGRQLCLLLWRPGDVLLGGGAPRTSGRRPFMLSGVQLSPQDLAWVGLVHLFSSLFSLEKKLYMTCTLPCQAA